MSVFVCSKSKVGNCDNRKNLGDIKVGENCKIIDFAKDLDFKLKRRINELGFLKGETVFIAQKSLLNEVLLVELCGYTISLRKNLADKIIVEKVRW